MARCDYFVIRLFDELDVVDTQRSTIETSERYSFLEVTKHLCLDEEKIGGLDIFRIDNMSFGAYLFCSGSFKAMSEKAGLNLIFVPTDEVAERYAWLHL